jgi:hypothetical protein
MCIARYREIHCELEFQKEKRSVLLEGRILQMSGLSVEMETTGENQAMLVVQLAPKDSLRFTRMVTGADAQTQSMPGQTQSIPGQTGRRTETVVRPKRKHNRLPKKFKVVYTIDIPAMNLERGGRSCPVLEPVHFPGESKDVSEQGIFVKSEFLPPLHAKIQVRMFTNKGMIETTGKVVRRVSEGENSGFALEIEKGAAPAQDRTSRASRKS